MARAATASDPLEGVTSKTTKDELMERLRKAAAALRRDAKQKRKRLDEVEDRLAAKREASIGSYGQELRQAIFSMTDEEWTELIEFLEEFEDLSPVGVRRLIVGGRILLGQIPTEPDPVPA